MLNHYPIWKNILIIAIILMATLYALPNVFGEDPALQIASSKRGVEIDTSTLATIEKKLKSEQIALKRATLREHLGKNNDLLIRFNNEEEQLKAKSIIENALGKQYSVAINLAPATPKWLLSMNALPMYLGLDLRGGVYFLMQVDMELAIKKTLNSYLSDSRTMLRKNKLRYRSAKIKDQSIQFYFRDEATREKAYELLRREMRDLNFIQLSITEKLVLQGEVLPEKLKEIQKFALKQNVTTLRKRIDEKFNGLVEPIIQQQGLDRIVIQLPGIQDTAGAKDILGATATLEYRAVDEEHDIQEALSRGAPIGAKIYHTREEYINGQRVASRPVLLKNDVIISGEHVTNANASVDTETMSPLVSVTLDSYGGKKMDDFTKDNVGKGMAVVYLETKRVKTTDKEGNSNFRSVTSEEVISVATIRGRFSNRFQTTGLESVQEANNLALLLRAGALAAPVYIIEERTIGPSLGQDNIDKGFMSIVIGFTAVLVFMTVWYRQMGMIANIALTLNLVIIVAVLSLFQATLTLPGIAGIVLTVGMAVDANVLIFERIREELNLGSTVQNSIHQGFEKAFSTIADANITTLIAAFILFVVGTGAVKGFAITLTIGIITSMFTAIVVCRCIINAIYGRRDLKTLSI